MPVKADVSGVRFGRLVATNIDKITRDNTGKSQRLVLCVCDCGNTHFATVHTLRGGGVRSCGCLAQENRSLSNIEHGHCPVSGPTKEYRAWLNIKQRCTNPKSSFWHRYGGRGISMHQPWAYSFDEFIAHIGTSPSPKHSIDRIDSNGNYAPGNVRWATAIEQARNKENYIKEEVRIAIREHRKQGLSYEKIAKLTGASPASVRNIILAG